MGEAPEGVNLPSAKPGLESCPVFLSFHVKVNMLVYLDFFPALQILPHIRKIDNRLIIKHIHIRLQMIVQYVRNIKCEAYDRIYFRWRGYSCFFPG